MAFALFQDQDMLSKTFTTEDEAWQHADEAGLVEVNDGKRILEDGYTIEACRTDPDGQVIQMPPPVTPEARSGDH